MGVVGLTRSGKSTFYQTLSHIVEPSRGMKVGVVGKDLLGPRPCSQLQRSCGLDFTGIDINSALKCSICSFQRTS